MYNKTVFTSCVSYGVMLFVVFSIKLNTFCRLFASKMCKLFLIICATYIFQVKHYLIELIFLTWLFS